MENRVFKNIKISTTSNKVDGKFKQEVNTKTAYLTADEQTTKELEAFGLQKYTSEKDKEDFFILKLANKLRLYYPDHHNELRQDLSNVELDGTETLNFKTKDDSTISINVVKGENMGNVFCRLQAILVDNASRIEPIEPENPFE